MKDACSATTPTGPDDHPVVRRAGQRLIYNSCRPELHQLFRRWRAIADSYQSDACSLARQRCSTRSSWRRSTERGLSSTWPSTSCCSVPRSRPELRQVVERPKPPFPAACPVWAAGSHDLSRYPTRWAEQPAAKTRCAVVVLAGLPAPRCSTTAMSSGCRTLGAPGSRPRPVPAVNGRQGTRSGPYADAVGTGARCRLHGPGSRALAALRRFKGCNVAGQVDDPGSMLSLARDILRLRAALPSLRRGAYRTLSALRRRAVGLVAGRDVVVAPTCPMLECRFPGSAAPSCSARHDRATESVSKPFSSWLRGRQPSSVSRCERDRGEGGRDMTELMTSRQRVLTALGHREPDRVPVSFGESASRASSITAPRLPGPCRLTGWRTRGADLLHRRRRQRAQRGRAPEAAPRGGHPGVASGSSRAGVPPRRGVVDAWGLVRHRRAVLGPGRQRGAAQRRHDVSPTSRPTARLARPEDPAIWAGKREEARRSATPATRSGGARDGPPGRPQLRLHARVRAVPDGHAGRPGFLARVQRSASPAGDRVPEAFLAHRRSRGLVRFGDELGTQRAPFMSPEGTASSQAVPPALDGGGPPARAQAPRSRSTPAAASTTVIPDFIEIGIEILNPIQPLPRKHGAVAAEAGVRSRPVVPRRRGHPGPAPHGT